MLNHLDLSRSWLLFRKQVWESGTRRMCNGFHQSDVSLKRDPKQQNRQPGVDHRGRRGGAGLTLYLTR
jgi:hypothetical protein